MENVVDISEVSAERLIKDELPEVTVNNENELRLFLEKYRNAMNFVFDKELGWEHDHDPYTRCGITAAMIMNALYNKTNVVGLQKPSVRRLAYDPYYAEDYHGMVHAKNAIKNISESTGSNTETVREVVEDIGGVAEWWYAHIETGKEISIEDPKIKESLEEIIEDYSESQKSVAQNVWEFYKRLSIIKPEFIKGASEYASSGWGHVVVLLDIKFDNSTSADRFIIDANSEQFGEDFDRLYIFPIEDAVKHGYTIKDIDPKPKKIEQNKLTGNTDKIVRGAGSTDHYFKIERQSIPISEVSRMIASKYRKE